MPEATLALLAYAAPTGQPIEGAEVILSIGQQGTTNQDGYVAFQVPVVDIGFSVHKAGYRDYVGTLSADVIAGNHDEPVYLQPKGGRISTSGIDLVRNGQKWFGQGASCFIAYEKFLDGVELRPQLDQLKRLGANCVDVWASYWNIAVNQGRPPFHTGLRVDGIERLPDFHALLAEYDLYALWVAFADPRIFNKSTAWEVQYWNQFNAALDPLDNVCSIILNNEHNAHQFNKVDRHTFAAPPRHVGICSSFTEMKTSDFPMTPKWAAGALHHNRQWGKVLKDACVSDHPYQKDYGSAIPVWLDEPIRIDPTLAADPMQSPEIIGRMAQVARASGAGIIYHSTDGKLAQLYGGYTLERAQAFFEVRR